MAEKTKVSLCAGLLATVLDENRELLLELQLKNALGAYEKAYPVLSELKIGDDLGIDAVGMPDTETSIMAITYLINKVRSFLEIFLGGDEATGRLAVAVDKFWKANSAEIDSTGLKAAMPDFFVEVEVEPDEPEEDYESEATDHFGIPQIDHLFRGGLQTDISLVIEGPAIVEKEIISQKFLKTGLEQEGCVIIVTSTKSPESIKKGIGSLGVDIEKADAEGRLFIVDWFTRHVRQITGIEETGSTVRISNDLTNLAVGIDIALKRAADCTSNRLFLDLVSPTIMVEGFDRVREFLDSVKAKLKNANCSAIISLNPEMHSPEEIKIIEDIFDGTILISRMAEQGVITTDFRILTLSTGPFDPSPLLLDINERGLAISDTDLKFNEQERMSFDQGDAKQSYGLGGIEAVTTGGLPAGKSFLIWASTKLNPGEVMKPIVFEAVRQDHAVILALATITPQEIEQWMGEIERSSSRLIDQGMLEVVDWHAQKDSRILGVEETNGIIRASKDLTHLGVGMDLAFRKLKEGADSLAILETLSPALRMFDPRIVYQFAQTISARLSMKGFTSFIVMDRDSHDTSIIAGMEEIFDGVLDIMDTGENLELAVLNIRGCHFLPEYRQLSRLRSGFSVDVAKRRTALDMQTGPEDLDVRIDRLNRELKAAVDEKTALQKRTSELMKRESELQSKHDELHHRLIELETKMAEERQMVDQMPSPAVNETHKKELAKILAVMDGLLENLPEDMIDKFAQSEEFKLYEKILDMYQEEEE